MKLIFRKSLSSLVPEDQEAQDVMSKIKHGDLVHVEVKRTRNLKHHRKYWALVNLVFENQERFANPQQIHNALKEAAGLYEVQQRLDGKPMRVLSSTSFEDMDQTAFAKYYDQCCDILAKTFLPGVTGETLRKEVEELIGANIPQRAA